MVEAADVEVTTAAIRPRRSKRMMHRPAMKAAKTHLLLASVAVAGTALGGVLALRSAANRPDMRSADAPAATETQKAEGRSAESTVQRTAARDLADVMDGIRLCQFLGPAAPHPIWAVDSLAVCGGEPTWDHAAHIDWQAYAQGEYIGHFRTPHVPEYRFRVDDQIEFRYRRTREQTNQAYRLQVGDIISVVSLVDDQLAEAQPRDLPELPTTGTIDQPQAVVLQDGTIILPLIGAVPAAGRTIIELRNALEEAYKQYYTVPAITVTPVRTNTKLQDVLDAVDARFGQGGQRILVTVSPDGTVQLPGLGSVFVQGLTDYEVKREVDERYRMIVEGIEVTPLLAARAPRFVYVVGEVGLPGQYPLTGPTTVMMALAMAGGYNGLGANLRQVVVLRRGDDWRMMATMLDIQGGLYGRRPCPADEIWLNDSDIVIVPKTPLRVANEWIDQVFTRGIYGIIPQAGPGIGINFSTTSSL
jgi:polysaccharide biosynthesis/export protein